MTFYFHSFLYVITKFIISCFNVLFLKIYLRLNHNLFNINLLKKSSKFFILGSGESINNISDSQWIEFKKHTTIGLNYFIMNEFVPDIIQIELQSADDEHIENLIKIFYKRENEFKNSKILVKSNYLGLKSAIKRIRFFKKLPKSLIKNLVFTLDFPIFGKNKVEFEKTLKMLSFLGLLNYGGLIFIPHLRASLGLSVIIGSRTNHNEIIAVGVDLINTKYFFQDNFFEYEKKFGIKKKFFNINYFQINHDGNHLTNDKSIHEITIMEALNLFLKISKTNSEVLTFSKKSALYPTFDEY